MKIVKATLSSDNVELPTMIRGSALRKVGIHLSAVAVGLASPLPAVTQEEDATGVEVAGLPVVNFDADEGFGYGVTGQAYQYGDGSAKPYVWNVQTAVFLTTRGKRDITAFLDAPGILQEGWRLDAFVGLEKRVTTPFYGLGNSTSYDPALEDAEGADPHYYGFGRERRSARLGLQRRIAQTPLRLALGLGLVRTVIQPIPEDRGTSLYAQSFGALEDRYWTNFVRAGVVWDTRDRETAPRSGSWTEVLVQWVDEGLGADVHFARWILIDRRYVSLGERITFAQRFLLQGLSGSPPVDQLQRVETSFKEAEGLGGSNTVRGLLKNRFTGRGMLVWNSEVRVRVVAFELFGWPLHLTLAGFLDQGRVWEGNVRLGELLSDHHRGVGGGVHVGRGENFVVTADVATSSETGAQVYLGVGYLY